MNRDLLALFWARVSMSAARALAGVVTPIYLALQGFSGLELGELWLVVAASSAVLSSAVGLLADRVGRRPWLIGVPMLAALAGVAFAFSRNVGVLFVMAGLGSFGRGAGAGAGAVGPYQPAESAIATELTPASSRNAVFGRLSLASSLGALVGGLAAATAGTGHPRGAAALVAYRPAFLVAAGLAVVAALVAVAVREPPARAGGEPGKRGIRFPGGSRPLLYRLWATNTVNGLAVGMFGPFVTYWLYRRFGVGAAQVGVLYAIINVATAAATLSAAGLARRFGLVRTVSVVRMAQAVLLVPMVLAPTFVIAGGFYLIRMVVQRIGLPLRQSYVVAMADPDERASVSALSQLPSQVAMAPSPLLAGYLFDQVSLELPFELAAVLQGLNAALFWFFFHRLAPEEELEVAPLEPPTQE